MKDSREIIPGRPPERRDLERPVEPQFTEPAAYPTYRQQNAEGSFQVYEYWRAIRKRLWLVVGIAVLMTTLTALYMSRQPNKYRAKATVQVDLEQANPDLETRDRRPAAMNNDPAYFNTQLQLLTSENLLRRVVKELDLENNTEFVRTMQDEQVSTTQSLLRSLGLATKDEKKEVRQLPADLATGSLETTDDMREALHLLPYVDILKKNLLIDPVRESRSGYKETRLIELSFQHTSPNLAATLVNGVAMVFTKQNFEKRNKTSAETSDFLQEQIADYQTKIKADEEGLANMTRSYGILKTEGDQTLVLQRLSVLNRQLLETSAERQKAEAKYRAAMRTGDTLTALAEQQNQTDITQRENIARGLEAQLRQKLEEFNADKRKLLVEYTENAPEVREKTEQILSVEAGMREIRERSRQDIQTYRDGAKKVISNVFLADFEKAKTQEARVKADYDREYNIAQSQNSAAIDMRIIEDRLKTNKEFLDSLVKQQRGNNVSAAGTDNNISVVDSALPSDIPIGPRRLMTVAVALILSTIFGAGLALFLEYLDDTIRSTEEVENYLGLPALAAIPTIDTLSRRRLLLVGNGEEGAPSGPGNRSTELLIHSDSRSSLAEAYRQLRTSILLSTAGHAPKSLLVTSSLPSEGKTTTAVNTAISLAQTGATVLIIDADMRRPRLHSIFGISNTEGLSSILSSAMTEKEILEIITYDEDTKLHMLPSGPVPPNPAELVGSDQMRSLLKTLEGTFTHVVVDSPPIASFTDGVLIGSLVDGVILVVHSGKSSKQVVKRSRQFLSEVGAKIFGVVLNNANLRAQDNYYYQSYYHRGYYRHDDESKNG